MRFANGLLGVTVVSIALAAAIMGAWVLSMDVDDTPITKYNYVTEITGLFESEQSPEYIEYNPSTNYTGYYTDSSIIEGTTYFDGVDYVKSSQLNNYRVEAPPTVFGQGSITLSDYAASNAFTNPHHVNFCWVDSDGNSHNFMSVNATTVTLSSFIEALNLGVDADLVEIRSNADLIVEDLIPGQDQTANWILFTTDSAWSKSAYTFAAVVGTSEWLEQQGLTPGQSIYGLVRNEPFLSCSVNLTTRTVLLYTDNNCMDPFNSYNLDDVYITYGPSGATSLVSIDYASTATYYAASPNVSYMDPSKGVSL